MAADWFILISWIGKVFSTGELKCELTLSDTIFRIYNFHNYFYLLLLMVFIVAGTAAATDGDEETPVSYESTL